MSTYVVRLNKWFPKNEEHYSIVKTIVKYRKCDSCGKGRIKYKKSMGHHSLMVGVGDVFCNRACFRRRFK